MNHLFYWVNRFYTASIGKNESSWFFLQPAKEKTNKTRGNLRCGVDKACWMCGPQITSHLDYWMDWGQGEGVELDSSITVRRRIRLLEKDPQFKKVAQTEKKLQPLIYGHVMAEGIIVVMILLFWQRSLWMNQTLYWSQRGKAST